MPSFEVTESMCNLRSSAVRSLLAVISIATVSACTENAAEQPPGDEWIRYDLRQLDGEPLPATLDDVRGNGVRCATTTYAATYELTPTRWRHREEMSSTCVKTPGDDRRGVVQDSGALRREGNHLTFMRFDARLQRDLELPPGRLVEDTLVFSDGVPEAIYVRIPR